MANEKPYAGVYKHTMTILALLGPTTALLVLRQAVLSFCRIFAEMSVSLPWLVLFAIAVVNVLCSWWPAIIGWLVVEAILMEKVVKRRSTARWIVALSWGIPWAITVVLMLLFLNAFYSLLNAIETVRQLGGKT